eukprot:335859-Pyramimonas_sp.AAC.2
MKCATKVTSHSHPTHSVDSRITVRALRAHRSASSVVNVGYRYSSRAARTHVHTDIITTTRQLPSGVVSGDK